MTTKADPRTERDPRHEPRPGDVVMFGPQWQYSRYEVVARHKERMVAYHVDFSREVINCTIDQWREWARSADVIRRSDA